jgi:dihydrofolate reductase
MGKIVISANVTLDGVVQDPDGEEGFARGGWFHQVVGAAELADWAARETDELLAAEALVLGRRSSEWFASRTLSGDGAEVRVSRAWADRMRGIPKYVVSSTLEDPRWGNATVLGGDAVKEVAELRRRVDGEILVYGSYQLLRALLDHGLVDEVRLVVFPVVLGAGRRLVDGTGGATRLRLVETRTLGEGLLFCAYQVVPAPVSGSGR